MSELLKRADNFNSLSDGTSGKNPVDAKLVADLADRVRELEDQINFAIEFVEDGKAGDAAVSWDAQTLIDKLRSTTRSSNPDKNLAKRIAVGFFQYWWNSPGTNTNQGFDTYWEKLRVNELELPSKYAVEDVTEEDVHETKFPPALAPFDLSNGNPDYIARYEQHLGHATREITTHGAREADRRFRKGSEGRKPRIKIITPEK